MWTILTIRNSRQQKIASAASWCILLFCPAILLLRDKAGLSEFTDQIVQRADVQEMIRRGKFFVGPGAGEAGYDKMTSLLKIHLKGGGVIAGRPAFWKSSPADPPAPPEARWEFRG